MPDLQPCGTRAAYLRHRRRGEEVCEPCRQANCDDHKEARAAWSNAQQAAWQALRVRYPDEFDALHSEEKAKEVVTGSPEQRSATRSRIRQRALRRLAANHRDEFDALKTVEITRARLAHA